jgi:shikimate kinase
MILVLIGYRGTGKSLMGKMLAKRLQLPCFAMDDEIVNRAGMSAPEIVEKYGWPKFRDIEAQVAQDLIRLDNVIIDTGGGVIERPENIEAINKNACVIWLKAEVDTIVARIQAGTQRPPLTEGKTFTEEVAEVLERRTPRYKSAAQYEIDTDHLAPDQLADRIVEIWKNHLQQH